MNSYKFAGLTINMEPKFNALQEKCEKYMVDYTDSPDFVAVLPENYLYKKFKENKLSIENSEYFWTGCAVHNKLLEYNIFVLHSSAVVLDGEAYLFSGNSGAGKSTHTHLWLKKFGDRAFILNDDKPAIKFVDDKFFVYGTPFSGESDENVNTFAPLKSISLIEKNDVNIISRLNSNQAIFKIMSQITKSKNPDRMDNLMNMLDKLFCQVPIYSLKCNISEDAVDLAYKTMKGIDTNEN